MNAANILLEITGDSSEARRELEDVARDLALFGRETAEAEADLDTTPAKEALEELKAKLAQFSADDVSADVNVRIAQAQADLAVLQAELDRIDGENVTVDVDVRRGIVAQVGALAREVEALGTAATESSGGASGLSGVIGGLGVSFGELGPIIAPLLVILGTDLVAALAALAASFAEAVAGAGALAVAFGVTLIPGIALAVGAIANFKEKSGEAGTAAHALKESFGEFGSAFKKATSGGSEALFGGLSEALKDLAPVVKELGPAFTELGEAGGDAFRALGKEFSSQTWRKFFKFTTESLTELTPLFERSFGAFAEILKNIATAAMPFLISGFRAVAKWLEGIADKTSNIHALRQVIGGLVDQLGKWLGLAKAVGEVFLGFIEDAAPQGKEMVEWLTEGAEAFADFLGSKQGKKEVQDFLKGAVETTEKLVEEVIRLAPIFAHVVEGVNNMLNPLLTVVGIVEDIIGSLKWIADNDPLSGLSIGSHFIEAWEKIFQLVKDKASTPINFVLGVGGDVLSVIRDIWKTAKDIVGEIIDFALHAPRNVLGVIRSIWGTAKDNVSKVINFVLKAPKTVLSVIRDIWKTAKGIISDIINFVLHAPRDVVGVARDIWQQVKGIINEVIDFVIGFPGDIVSRARDIWQKVKDAVSGGIDLVINVIADVGSLPGKVKDLLGFADGVIDLRETQFAMVGERGPELAFLPQGTDIYTANQTRSILKALSKGSSQSITAGRAVTPALAGGGGGDTFIRQTFVTPGTGNPDPRIAAAQMALMMRQKGRR